MTSYSNLINYPHHLVNMEATAVYINCSSNRKVHMKGKQTISVMIGGAKSM